MYVVAWSFITLEEFVNKTGLILKHVTSYITFHCKVITSIWPSNIIKFCFYRKIHVVMPSYNWSKYKLPCSAGMSSEKQFRWKVTTTFPIGIIQAPLLFHTDTDVSVGHAASVYTIEKRKLQLSTVNCKRRQNFL